MIVTEARLALRRGLSRQYPPDVSVGDVVQLVRTLPYLSCHPDCSDVEPSRCP
jgi:hypothetical protein